MIVQYLKPLTKNELVVSNTQQFPSMLNNVPLPKDKENVSNLVLQIFPSKKLLTLFPMKFTTVKLTYLFLKSIFEKLLYKLTAECTFSVTDLVNR